MIPAALYSVQNLAALCAYQNLDSLTFNVLNQTKTLSAALCCYFVMGRRQSPIQVFSLFLLLLSALIMEGIITVDWQTQHRSADDAASSEEWKTHHITHGVFPVILASFISGLAGALTQKNLQAASKPRNPYLFSMELCAASCLILLASLAVSSDGRQIREYGVAKDWSLQTMIPILSNSFGGIVVGLVTKHAGSVRKGFALIFGMLLSGVIQALLEPDVGVSRGQVIGGVLAAVSLYLHATHPPAKLVDKANKQD